MRIRMSGGVGRVIRKDGPYPIYFNGPLCCWELGW